MEPLSSIVTTIGDLFALAAAAINLVIAIRPRNHRSGAHDQQHPEDGQQAGR